MGRRTRSFRLEGFILLFHLLLSSHFALILESDSIGFLGIYFSLGLCIWLFYEIISTFYTSWLAVKLGMNINFTDLGDWAVVTGATDGIGLAYCNLLAERGLNVVLISRTIDRLQECSYNIQNKFHVKTKIIQVHNL
jgi:hypothetical protein